VGGAREMEESLKADSNQNLMSDYRKISPISTLSK
jgi:hypothetical protein